MFLRAQRFSFIKRKGTENVYQILRKKIETIKLNEIHWVICYLVHICDVLCMFEFICAEKYSESKYASTLTLFICMLVGAKGFKVRANSI